ncbi:unnamed protein product [Rotaria socialis]|nr:unnamed protein product [Rotaria socialis]CAF4860774.1 unnamed protein product [Rotaria socialis]
MDVRDSLFENKGLSSFESLSVELLYELLEYFNLEQILHSFTNVSSHLDWIIFNDHCFHFRDVQLSSESRHLHPQIDATRIISLTLNHNSVCLSKFINLRSFSLRTRCGHPDRLRKTSEELLALKKLTSFKLNITGYFWNGEDDYEDPEDESHGLIPAALAHSTLKCFTLKAPYVSFPECNNGLPSSLPVSSSLQYVEIPSYFTSFCFVDPLNLFPVVRHIYFGSRRPHRLVHPHVHLCSLVLEIYYWPVVDLYSFLIQLVVLKKLTVYGFVDFKEKQIFDCTCLLPLMSALRVVDINVSIHVLPDDETVEQFKQELEKERIRSMWQELQITPVVESCTRLKGLLKKK